MDQVVVFQKMFEQVRKEQNFSWFYSELKHHRIAHYIYYLATDNIRIITHDDTVLLLRGTRNLLKVSTTKNPAKIKEAALLHICGKSTFREYCSTLAGAGVFRWVTDVNHNKRSYYAIDNTLLYIEDVENNKPRGFFFTSTWDLRAPAPTPSHLRATVAIKGSFRGAEF